MQPASGGVHVQDRPLEILHKNRIRRAFKQITKPLLAFMQCLLGVDSLQRASAMIGQRLQRVQILLVVSPERVTLDRKNADNLGSIPNRRQHQRSRRPRSIADRQDILRHYQRQFA